MSKVCLAYTTLPPVNEGMTDWLIMEPNYRLLVGGKTSLLSCAELKRLTPSAARYISED